MAAHPANVRTDHEVDALLASELLGAAAGRVEALPESPGLHVCPSCERPFVVPGRAREVVGVSSVRLELRCTNCGWTDVAVHADEALACLEMELDRSFADLLWTLEVVWTANEEAAIQRFAAAVDAGAILPEDF
jgi:hypothetical protein